MSGLTAGTLPFLCGAGVVTCTRSALKGQYNTDTSMQELQVGGLSRLQAREGRDEKEKVRDSTRDYNGKGTLCQAHHLRTTPRGDDASAALSCTDLHALP
jgi:hypothetical protein